MQRLRTLSLFLLPVLMMLGLSDTALGQTLNIFDTQDPPVELPYNPTTGMTFNVVGGQSQSQIVTANTSVPTTISWQADSATQTPVSWLKINGGVNGSDNTTLVAPFSKSLTITVSSAGLNQGTYTGTFMVWISSNPSVVRTVKVVMNVTGSSVLSANPSSLVFTALAGSSVASPSSAQVVVNSNTVAMNLNITPFTNQGNWLQTSTTGVTGQAFTVSVNPTGLGIGTYTGNITAQSTTTADATVISVTLTVGSSSTLTTSPATPPPFLYQIGGTAPASQNITVNSASSTTVSISVSSGALWLVPNSTGGFVGPSNPLAFSLSVNVTGLTAGTYNATVNLTPQAGNPLQVPIKLVVSSNPLLQVSPNALTFTGPFAGSSPADKTATISVLGTGNAVGFNISDDATWLTTNVSSNFAATGSPATLTVHVDPAGLPVGTYNGIVTIQPTNGDNYVQTVAVTYIVGTSATVTVAPPVLFFSYQTTIALPSAQILRITSPAQSIGFNVTTAVSNCGTSWLGAQSSGTTPADISVSVNGNISGAPGTCNGQVTITYSGSQTINVPVTVQVSQDPILVIGQPAGFGSYVVAQGGVVNGQQLSITSTNPGATPLQFTAQANCGWLSLAGGAGTTPANIFVTFLSSNLLPGSYGCNLVITSSSLPGGLFTIPVSLLVTPNVSVSLAPTALTFAQPFGGAPPAAQTLTFSSTGGTPAFEATISQGCADLIGVTPSSGTATGTVSVSVLQNSRSLGTYNCQISFVFQGASTQSQTVQVTVNVANPQTLVAAPTSLNFAYQLTAGQPPSQKFTVTSTGGSVQFAVGTTSTPTGWLTADISGGVTGASGKEVNISVNTQNLAVGRYNGSVTLTATGIQTVTIAVVLDVTSAPTPLPLTIASTASNQAGPISPGVLMTIKGTLLGPTTQGGVLFSLNAQGGVDSTLGGVQVTFDGIPGTPIYVSATQINVIAPYEISGRTSVNVVVIYNGVSSAPINVRVVEATPAIFTLNQQGFGQAAALNQNGTFNGPAGGGTVPATQDSVVAIYATGGGQTSPPGTTGSVSPTNRLLLINGIVSATVDGVSANIEFAGAAPGLVTGVNQYNIRIPRPQPGKPMTGNLSIQITINGVSSPLGVTIAVQ